MLISNTSRPHLEWIRRQSDLLENFDAMALSFEVGACKPEAAIYERALELIRCPPQLCLYVDDIPAYVARGQSFGLLGEVFAGANRLRQRIRELGSELPA